jgi:two-component system LytT family response regulator
MEILIVEDEKPAIEKLSQMILDYDPKINIVGRLGSIRESVKWLKTHKHPNLIILDIQLSDGISLEIFKKCKVNSPVIFITAYDEYIMESFNYNSIDYLLKPIKQDRFENALNKYLNLKYHFVQDVSALIDDLAQTKTKYKNRITVKKGVDFLTIKTDDVAYFCSEYKLVFLITHNSEKLLVNRTLTNLEEELNPNIFFRANRKYIVNINAIVKFKSNERGKIKIETKPKAGEDIYISQEKAPVFRNWIESK